MSPFLDHERLAAHQWCNTAHTSLLIAGIGAVTLVSAFLIAGWLGVLVAAGVVALVFAVGPRVSPERVMRMYRAQRVDPAGGGQLTRLVEILADRAELKAHPRLYVVPSLTLNAFATGTPDHAAIAVTEGLLRRLSLREIAGVLAHEISHVRNNDLFVMGLADAMSRLTQLLAYLGFGLALLNIPAMLLGLDTFSWFAILLLYLAPTVASLLQLALSRSREFDADMEAAGLTGDPLGLAAALSFLERNEGRFWEDLMFPVPARRIPQPSLLRSHPETAERIARLKDVGTLPSAPPIVLVEEPMFTMVGHGLGELAPRYRWPGLWY
ncbi:MAG: zinc metalloprotease HtpX [Hyphomicrobiaceae bacterium]